MKKAKMHRFATVVIAAVCALTGGQRAEASIQQAGPVTVVDAGAADAPLIDPAAVAENGNSQADSDKAWLVLAFMAVVAVFALAFLSATSAISSTNANTKKLVALAETSVDLQRKILAQLVANGRSS